MDVRIGDGFRVEPFEFRPPVEPSVSGDQLGFGQAVRLHALDHVGGLNGEVKAAGGHLRTST